MSDIVERLRRCADRERPYGPVSDICDEAADEIERLRAGGCARDQGTTQYCAEAAKLAAENERLREWNAEIALNAREFAAEIERLRAALELFACDCIESGNLCPSPQNCRNYIARAALEGK